MNFQADILDHRSPGALLGAGARLALAALLTLPAVGSMAAAAATPSSTQSVPMLPMKLAGVGLGLPVDAAQAAATAAGYACRRSGHRPSFDDLVKVEVMKRRGQPMPFFLEGTEPNEVSCAGPWGEELTLEIDQTSAGSIVDAIRFYADKRKVDPAAIERQIRADWPKPNQGTALDGYWCAPTCTGPGSAGASTFKTSSAGSNAVGVFAYRGAAAHHADEAAIDAAAARLAPASRKAAF